MTAALLTDRPAIDTTQTQVLADGIITLSGSYPTNGDTLDLSQLGIPSTFVPTKVEVFEATPAAGKPASGYAFVFLPGTTQANGIVEMFNGTSQVTTQTYADLDLPADFVLQFRASFPSLL